MQYYKDVIIGSEKKFAIYVCKNSMHPKSKQFSLNMKITSKIHFKNSVDLER